MDPIDNVKRFHHGCDFSVNIGTPVYRLTDGAVKLVLGGFGNHVKLDHLVPDIQQFLLTYQK